jgi:hypothetical protein
MALQNIAKEPQARRFEHEKNIKGRGVQMIQRES